MVMSLLVGRVLYLVFDWLARAVFWILHEMLGIPSTALNPVFGFHGAESEEAGPAEAGSRNGSADASTRGIEKVHT